MGTYGAPIYALRDVRCTQTKLKLKVAPRTDIEYLPAENEEECQAVEAIVYLGTQDTISIPSSAQNECVFSGLVPNSSYRVSGLIRYSDGYEMCIPYDKEITTQGTNPIISVAASTPTIVKYTGKFTLIDAHISGILVNGQPVNPSLAVNVGGDDYEVNIQEKD